MKLFRILNFINPKSFQHEMLGLKYLEGFTKSITNPKRLKKNEWRRQLVSSTGGALFKIKFYGDLQEGNEPLIVPTDFAPQKVVAIDCHSKEEVLIYDGCKYGYNAMFCDQYSQDQIANRPTNNYLRLETGQFEFEIFIAAYYGMDFEELKRNVDKEGKITLVNGQRMDFETAKGNCCDAISIWVKGENGGIVEILAEELA